ncbi:MAG: HvfC/BufC N-terminal domain-containing protein [Marinosulfonomonas sp.]
MTVGQSEFSTAILNPEQAVPSGLSDPEGRPAGRRFSVYRNNVAVSLTDALKVAFPVVTKLVGDEFFTAMAGVFLRQHPPSSPLMMYYGAEFAGFLEGFEPVAHLGYLPDVARLEQALRLSYHAADANPVSPDTMQSIAPERLMTAQFVLVPSVRLVHSQWPIYSIWLVNTDDTAPAPQMRAEAVLITRPEFDPMPVLLPEGGAEFMLTLGKGRSFSDAVEAAGEGFDLTTMIGHLLAGQTIAKINLGD